jgi:predicted nucleotidyltransferase
MVNILILKEVLEMLKPFKYVFFSGMAMEVYTNGKRKAKDFDIIVDKEDIEEFAKLINCKLDYRKIVKEDYHSEDYGGVVDYKGQEIELTSGFPKKRVEDATIKKLFERRKKVNYLGLNIYVVPIEETIAFKALMHREKDYIDLEMLKEIEFDINLVKEYARDWGQEEKAIKILKEAGFIKI